MPGGTVGSPTAPSRIASCSRSSREHRVGQQLAGAVPAGGAEVVLGGLDVGSDPPQDLEALGHHLGTDAVTGDHCQPHG